jgi:translation initiation factor IF-3
LLSEGDKVKLAVMFRGREMSHPEIGREVMTRALDNLKEVAIVERPPSMEGRFLSVILTPGLKKATKAESDEPPADGSAEEAETPAEPQPDNEAAATKAKVTG